MKINFDSKKKQNPVYEDGMKIPYAPAKRAWAAWRWYLVVIITASPLLFFLGKILLSYLYISAPGMIFLKKIELNAPETALITKIHIKKGETIAAGAKFADLSDPALDDQTAALNGEMERLRKETVPTLDRLEANIELARKILDSRSTYLGQVKYLFAKGAATAAELNLATTQYHQAQLEVSRAKADWAASRGVKPADTGSRTVWLKNQVETIDNKRTRLELRSPVSGIVSERLVSENQSVSRGTPLAKIHIPGEYSIKAYVNPSEINHARKGKKVTIRMPGKYLLTGHITSDPSTARTMPSDQMNPFSETRERIEVDITPSTPLPAQYHIDNLPIKVYFGFLCF